MQRRDQDEIVRIALDLRKANTPWVDIAQTLGMTRQRIAQILKANGVDLMGMRNHAIGEAVAEIIGNLQRDGRTCSAHGIYMILRAQGIRTSPSRVAQELRATGAAVRSTNGGHPPMTGPDGMIHCPRCGWIPADRFTNKVRERQKNGHLCRACLSARYQRRRQGAIQAKGVETPES